jgi:hypothetical protein
MRWLKTYSSDEHSQNERINVDKIDTISWVKVEEYGYYVIEFFAYINNKRSKICGVHISHGSQYDTYEFFEKILNAINETKDGQTIDLQELFPKPVKRSKKLKPTVW